MIFRITTISGRSRVRRRANRLCLAAAGALCLLHVGGCRPGPEIDALAPRLTMTNSIEMDFGWIPPGAFVMGSDEPLAVERGDGPRQRVTISKGFWMGTHEVTQVEYETIMSANPSRFASGGDDKAAVAGLDTSRFPVDHVTWEEAVEFCRRLTRLPEEQRAGRRYRLPTDAEWEYACRASSTERFSTGSELTTSQANIAAPSEGTPALDRPTRVGSYSPNAWGLYDMHGNVAEWCFDGKREFNLASAVDPEGPQAFRPVLRGGAWDLPADYARSDRRVTALRGYVFFGFRVVCEQPENN